MPSPRPTNPPPPLTEEQRTQTLPPAAEPLLVVAYGRMHAKGYPKLDPAEAPPPKARLCLQQALRLAEALILHPLSMQVATRIFAPSSPDNPLVERAIRAALHEMRIAIYIDRDATSDGPAGMFGKHCRPQQTDFNKTMAQSIFVNPWYVERLMAAYDNRAKHPQNYERHIFLTADGLAHELIHLLRSQVFFRLQGSGLHIANETPSQSPANGGAPNGEPGWEFEDAILGGALFGGWLQDRSPSPAEDEKNTTDVSEDVAALAQLLASDGQTPSLDYQRTPLSRRNDPFDILILGRHVDGREENYGIEDSWIHELISVFEDVGNINSIAFPPAITPEPLPPWKYTRISMRASKRRDIIRSYEISWLDSPSPKKR